MELGAIIAGLVAIAAALLKWYLGKDKTYENVQVGRRDIVNGNTDAVSTRVDKLMLSVPAGQRDTPAGISDDQDIARRIAEITK